MKKFANTGESWNSEESAEGGREHSLKNDCNARTRHKPEAPEDNTKIREGETSSGDDLLKHQRKTEKSLHEFQQPQTFKVFRKALGSWRDHTIIQELRANILERYLKIYPFSTSWKAFFHVCALRVKQDDNASSF